MIRETQIALSKLEEWLRLTDDAYALPKDGARFCHAVVLATGARRALEIGTGYGYSTLWIAAAMAEFHAQASGNGHIEKSAKPELITIDHDERKVEAARTAIKQSGVGELVRFQVGHSLEVLERVEGPFDFVLNDADKEHCRRYVELLAPKMRPRGVILTDNISTHAAQLSQFLMWLRARNDFFSTPVMVGNGMELSVKLCS